MRIPPQLIAVLSEIVSKSETHATMDNLFMNAGAPGDPPEGSKLVKAQAWLRRIAKDPTVDTCEVLGLLIEGYMEPPMTSQSPWDTNVELHDGQKATIAVIEAALQRASLRYFPGGKVSPITGSPTKSMKQLIEQFDFAAIDQEFERAIKNVDVSPREAVSAACNILESVFKLYIDLNDLETPKKMDIQSLWKVVRNNLGFDPGKVEDRDLKEILSGLAAVTGGIGSLRSHASSAHGAGGRSYKLEPRHARLAIHGAHTLAIFVLETWSDRNGGMLPP